MLYSVFPKYKDSLIKVEVGEWLSLENNISTSYAEFVDSSTDIQTYTFTSLLIATV